MKISGPSGFVSPILRVCVVPSIASESVVIAGSALFGEIVR